jgi:site-specific recombinase XerD
LFRFENGKPLTPKVVNSVIKDLCTRCGLNPKAFVSHCLRKGGITDTLCTGVPDSIVQILSRHANLDSLRPYKLLSDESLGTILSAHLGRFRSEARARYFHERTGSETSEGH